MAKASDWFQTGEAGDDTTNADLVAAIDSGISVMKAKLAAEGADKTLLTDLVRLLQLRKELDGERPREIHVRWIEDE